MKGLNDRGNKVVNGKAAKMQLVLRLKVPQVSSPLGTGGRGRTHTSVSSVTSWVSNHTEL